MKVSIKSIHEPMRARDIKLVYDRNILDIDDEVHNLNKMFLETNWMKTFDYDNVLNLGYWLSLEEMFAEFNN